MARRITEDVDMTDEMLSTVEKALTVLIARLADRIEHGNLAYEEWLEAANLLIRTCEAAKK